MHAGLLQFCSSIDDSLLVFDDDSAMPFPGPVAQCPRHTVSFPDY